VGWHGRPAERWRGLDFFALLFVSRQKVGRKKTKEKTPPCQGGPKKRDPVRVILKTLFASKFLIRHAARLNVCIAKQNCCALDPKPVSLPISNAVTCELARPARGAMARPWFFCPTFCIKTKSRKKENNKYIPASQGLEKNYFFRSRNWCMQPDLSFATRNIKTRHLTLSLWAILLLTL